MARKVGTLKLSTNIEPLVGAPLDARTVVQTKAELTTAGNFDYAYVGMIVSVETTGEVYILKAKPATNIDNWAAVASAGEVGDMYYTKEEIDNGWYNKEQVDQLLVKLYKPAGSATLATLPELTADVIGNVYNMTEAFETTSDFVEGADVAYGVGTNVVVVDLGGYTAVSPLGSEDPSDEGWYEIKNGVYVLSQDTEIDAELVPAKTYYSYTADPAFDVLPGFVDLSGYQTKLQVEELPTASEDEEGKIYQYIGANTFDDVTGAPVYTNGYFYICVGTEDDTTGETTYDWQLKPVQDMSGTGELAEDLNVTKEAGGINVGAAYAAGTVFETLWRDLLNPLEDPELVAPSVELTTASPLVMKTGSTASVTLTANFNRGSITPSNGTSGYRSGAADSYSLNGGTSQSTGEFTSVTVSSENKTFTATVTYGVGEQPKNSRGGDYSTPLSAGSVESEALEFEFVDPLWANTASISSIAELAVVSKTAKSKEFTFPPATVANPEVFDVPASWTITAVEVYNTLAGTWEDCAAEYDITNTTHDDAAGTSVNYKRYTNNLGYDMGTRRIKIKWS